MKRLIATAALAGLVASPAFAQSYQYDPNEGPYLGAGIGHATLDDDGLDVLDRRGFNTDDSDTGYKLFVGYQFNPNFAVEAGYVDFGETSATGNQGGTISLGVEAFSAALVGKLPIQNGFSVHGKLGLAAWEEDPSGSAVNNGSYYSLGSGEDGTDPFYGLGAEYVVNQVMLRAEYEYFDLNGDYGDFSYDLISASLGYRF
ncbi:outer membrane beta-barrel protein [Halomonas sp. 11-S5]|uniref:outer membrane beta-barrel protein n=1 Tax=Halomonas sp. 11-S5 TaxID=2994064 RepID=UPI0024683D01|nr:outer membrane beta-barrel protein [Halomonas sp. 11-S5]